MSAPLRLRLALVALVATIQVVSVAAVLMVQNGVAERAMLERGRAQMADQTYNVRSALEESVGEFRATTETVALSVQGLPWVRSRTDAPIRDAAMLLLGALIRNPDVESATLAFDAGGALEMRRGGPSGFEFFTSDGRYAMVGDATISGKGSLVLTQRGTPPPEDLWARPAYKEALGLPRVVLGYDRSTGALIAARRLTAGPAAVGVVALRARTSMLSSLVEEKPITGGGFAALLPYEGGLPGWFASGARGDELTLDRGRELRRALRDGARHGGSERLVTLRYRGRETSASVVPFHEADFTGSIVVASPTAELTAGAGSVVRSWSLALLAGLIAGIVVLPLVYRATRPVGALHRRATLDALTGLANRDELMRGGTRLLARARRRARPMAVAVLDLDGFKEINDRHGHHAGDEVLRAFAQRLRGAVRRDDLVARLGGDEFVVILAGDGLVAAEVFERLLEDLTREPVRSSAGVHRALCTVGLALAAPDESVEAVLARADAALITGKATAKGSVYLAGAQATADAVHA